MLQLVLLVLAVSSAMGSVCALWLTVQALQQRRAPRADAPATPLEEREPVVLPTPHDRKKAKGKQQVAESKAKPKRSRTRRRGSLVDSLAARVARPGQDEPPEEQPAERAGADIDQPPTIEAPDTKPTPTAKTPRPSAPTPIAEKTDANEPNPEEPAAEADWMAAGRKARSQTEQPQPVAPPRTAAAKPKTSPTPNNPDSERHFDLQEETDPRDRIYAISRELKQFYQETAHPKDLHEQRPFQAGITTLAEPAFDDKDLLRYAAGDNGVIACMAIAALGRRVSRDNEVDLLEQITTTANVLSPWVRYFALECLGRFRQPVVSRLLSRIDGAWDDHYSRSFLADFLSERITNRRESFAFEAAWPVPAAENNAAFVPKILDKLGSPRGEALRNAYQAWLNSRVDLSDLEGVGQLLQQSEASDLVSHEALQRTVNRLHRHLAGRARQSVMLVGEQGVGKTSAIETLRNKLLGEGWTIFAAGAVDLLAGQSHIGDLEQRVQDLIGVLDRKPKMCWLIHDLVELEAAGRHKHSQTSALDMLVPYLEERRIILLGQLQPSAWEQLLLASPRLRSLFAVVTMEPLSESATLQMAAQWANQEQRAASHRIDARTLQEALELARQYLSEQELPGSLMSLLREASSATEDSTAATPPPTSDRQRLLQALSRLTGLSMALLDDRQGLDLKALRQHFDRRVMGQTEAAECLVERIALIKAGLTDPSRPQGVFLFTGPSGTGKTEIAKSLAEYLFGSERRMVRIDMSELQDGDLDRLLGSSSGSATHRRSLVDEIRKQPFSVVLLDEIEKAHPRVLDLFLQVFDDGRLTDHRGRVVDFRHAIILMTSNLGAREVEGTNLGFAPGADGQVGKSLENTFRPEFLNRIDRVVMFRSLDKMVMRRVLEKELRSVLQRRGLRSREWVVEWDESALDFLLEQGFSTRLGARPLRRAVEQHLLAPLALAIVDHQTPEGDQFLLVRAANSKIEVEFVDPDAPESGAKAQAAAALAAQDDEDEPLNLRGICLDARGKPAEVAVLDQHLALLIEVVTGDQFTGDKQAALDLMEQDGFWQDDDRYDVLAQIEQMERIQTGLQTAQRWRQQLGDGPGQQDYEAASIGKLAQQIYLLQLACEDLRLQKNDVYLGIEVIPDPNVNESKSQACAEQLANMYRGFVDARRMELSELGSDDKLAPFHAILRVSGFGAHSILMPEAGIHVFERDRRHRLRVSVIPCPSGPQRGQRETFTAARSALIANRGQTRTVRRYHERDRLIKDSIRGWRTGRWDTVLQGNFDLF